MIFRAYLKIAALLILNGFSIQLQGQNKIRLLFNTEANSTKYGLMDLNGNVFVTPKYAQIEKYTDTVLIVRENKEYQLIDLNGNELLAQTYKYISSIKHGAAVIMDMGRGYGIINSNFRVVVEPKYQEIIINPWTNIFRYMNDGKYGYIDSNGEVISKPVFNNAQSFIGKIAFVKKDQKWGVIDRIGNFLIEPRFDGSDDYSNMHIKVWDAGKYGFVSTEGKPLIGVDYKWCAYGENNTYKTYMGDGVTFYDSTGNKLVHYPLETISCINYNLFHIINENNQHGLIDAHGKYLVDGIYDNILEFSDNLILLRKDSLYYQLDANYNIGKNNVYKHIEPWQQFGFICYAQNGKWGMMDTCGKQHIQSILYEIKPVDSRAVRYLLENKFGLMDTHGKILTAAKYNAINNFRYNLATVLKNNKYGVIDIAGKEIVAAEFEQIIIEQNFLLLKQEHGFALANTKGSLIGRFAFDQITEIQGDFLIFRKGEKYGVLYKDGKIIVEAEKYTALKFSPSQY